MKTEITDVSETQKTLTIEIPTDVVDTEINRVAHGYTRQARVPGFRPGKVPKTLVKQRFRDQILHDVMHDLIPRAIDEALQARGLEPVDTPDVRDVKLAEGQPLTFTAAFETVPSFDPGDLSSLTVPQPPTAIGEEAVDQALQRLRERAATYETVEGRPSADGDTVLLSIDRTGPDGIVDHRDETAIEIGAPDNPPGFDANLVGLSDGESRTFSVQLPDTYPAAELAGTAQTYAVTLKGIRRRILPGLDDELAKDLGDFESLAALRERVRADLEEDARDSARRQVRAELIRQLAQRVPFDVPASLVEREMDRRVQELARQLMAQRVDPRQAGIDWAQLRESQRAPSREAVAGTLVLDQIARREEITVSEADVDKEIDELAARAGRTPAAVRAQLDKEGGIARFYVGLRRERAVDLALSRAKMTTE